jgi:RimJ/RimL family protein N-acetyltransferase
MCIFYAKILNNVELAMINLETDRLFIRPLNVLDAADFFLYRSNEEANKYQGWIPRNLGDVYNFIHFKTVQEPNIPDTWIQLAVTDKRNNKLIGDIGVYFMPEEHQEVKLGYTLAQTHWGKGYASEMLHAIIDHLHHHLSKTRFFALICPDNIASIQLVKRLHFTLVQAHVLPEYQTEQFPEDLIYMLDLNLKPH